eukprot:scaffold241102_cov15-Tisochrysis_lutea.AAC.1
MHNKHIRNAVPFRHNGPNFHTQQVSMQIKPAHTHPVGSDIGDGQLELACSEGWVEGAIVLKLRQHELQRADVAGV